MNRPRLLSLFSGIGGFELGLERAGFVTVAQCEISPKCRHLLNHHWPHVPCYEDVTTLTADRLQADGIGIDAICGGFPCQDISAANPSAVGIEGERSGLWREFARLVREIRPRLAFVENSPMLLSRGLGRVLGDLAAVGYDAVWDCLSASDFGAPIIRERLYVLAFPMCEGRERREQYLRALSCAKAASALCGDRFADARLALAGDLSRLRADHGFSVAVERARIHGLGNAVLPIIPELIGREVVATLSRTAHRTTAPLIERLPPNTSEAA
jgi:DNA (cytosine-5)-methyltransferase 1